MPPINPSVRPAWRAWLPRILLYAALHYLLLLVLESIVFLVAHIPPQLIDASPLVIGFTWLGLALNFPRMLLRHLWLSEVTPGWLNLLLIITNSLLFGAGWYAWRRWRKRP